MDLQLYSVVWLIDTEKNLSNSEIENLQFHFENNNLSIFIISEWNNKEIIKFLTTKFDLNYKDNNVFGGSEIASINYLLQNYGFEIGEDSLSYEFYFNKKILKVIII